MEVLSYFLPEELYMIISIIYLWNLNILNTKLYALGNDVVKILSYDEGKPLYYFIGAIILFVTGIYLIFKRGKIFFYHECEYKEMLLNIGAIIIIFFLLIAIFVFINNPILRAVISAIAFIACLSMSS